MRRQGQEHDASDGFYPVEASPEKKREKIPDRSVAIPGGRGGTGGEGGSPEKGDKALEGGRKSKGDVKAKPLETKGAEGGGEDLSIMIDEHGYV